MSRTGLYWTDDQDRLCCSHGLILYGSKCLRCERGDIIDPNLTPLHQRVSGFDTASGPDRTVTITVDDIKADYDWREAVERHTREAINGNHEQMAAMKARMDDAVRRAMSGDYRRWEHSRGDPRTRESHWGGPPRARAIEVITDPLDQRGVNARRVGPGRWPAISSATPRRTRAGKSRSRLPSSPTDTRATASTRRPSTPSYISSRRGTARPASLLP